MLKKYLVVHFYIKRKKEHSWRNTLCCVHLKILKFSYIILLVLFEWFFFLLLFLEEQNASKIIASLYHTLCWCLYIIWLMLIALPLLLVMLFFYPSWCHLSNLMFCYFILSLNDRSTQIWVREREKIQIRNSRWMCQKAEPLVRGTVRKLVNTGIHLVCVFSTYTKRRSCYNSAKWATTSISRILFILFVELGRM